MRRRHPPIPRVWLMTDERMGNALWAALDRLPRGAGVVFRHYAVAPGERRLLMRNVAKVARKRGLILVRAGEGLGARKDGVHNGRAARAGLRTASAHSRLEAIAAIRAGADALFVSPVFATRSHAEGRTLGRVRFGLMIRGLGVPVIALGGMNRARGRGLRALGAYGWAGIDAWLNG
ncbi:MAG: thiamine phosphate synthase [Sphingomonas sp.]